MGVNRCAVAGLEQLKTFKIFPSVKIWNSLLVSLSKKKIVVYPMEIFTISWVMLEKGSYDRGENRQLGTHEPVEFQKSPAEVQDDCRKITHHFRGIYRILPQFNKGKIGDCQLVAAWTCKHWYLKPVIMPKTSPITAPKCLGGCFWYSLTHLGSTSQHVSRGLEFCLLMGFLVIHPNLSLLNHFRFAIQV